MLEERRSLLFIEALCLGQHVSRLGLGTGEKTDAWLWLLLCFLKCAAGLQFE
jgi:hypothetical protein